MLQKTKTKKPLTDKEKCTGNLAVLEHRVRWDCLYGGGGYSNNRMRREGGGVIPKERGGGDGIWAGLCK